MADRLRIENDARADVMALAQAFRLANDEDTRKVLNAMAEKSPSSLKSLNFYAVAASWFRKAWPILTSPLAISNDNWREEIGDIKNKELVEDTVQDDDAYSGEKRSGDEKDSAALLPSNNMNKNAIQSRQHSSNSSLRIRLTMEHEKDYFLLGPSAWMLVKEKFGFDGYEIQRSCVFAGQNQNEVAIQMLDGENAQDPLIIVPPSGRFSFERALQQDNASDIKDHEEHPATDSTPFQTTLGASTDDVSAKNSQNEMDWDADGAKKKIISRKRYATGLGNLGNTCFMNSTLQCLAHTDPLRKYFLSGEYEKELNKHNTLGTGGELASQFASLLAEMWGVQLKRRNVLGNAGSTYSSPDSAVYPRNFKHTLGKHAEQFVGYDQHDSQELATYLLDALHEDTNRVTQKPYIEKPEQGEDETDEIAAEKAWNLHLQREDSRVLDSFMGQVKSRVQCCEATCSRVSTTFDPFMFLSVPVPGSTDRELNVTFVPLHAGEEILNLNLILPKSATIKVMLQQLGKDLVAKGFRKEKIPVEDLCAVDVWRHDVYKWYTEDEEVDRIRDSDKTYIYELRSLKETNGSEDQDAVDGNCSAFNELRLKQRAFKCKLDVETLTSLNKDDEWMDTLAKYVRNPTQVLTVLNAARSTTEDRARFHKKLEDFIDACYLKFSGDESTGQKRARDEDPESETVPSVSEDNNVPGLVQVSDASEVFQGVSIQKDLAILEFCSSKLRQYAKELEKEKVERRSRGGVCIQAGTERQSGPFGGRPASSEVLMFPLVLRIPSNMTVYQLRNELAARYRIFDENSEESNLHGMNGMEIEHEPSKSPTESEDKALCLSVKDAFLQMPLLYKKKTAYSYRPQGEGSCQLGMLSGDESDHESTTADPRNEAERVNVFDTVGLHGSVTLKLPSHVNHKGLCVDNPIKNVRGATDENAQKVITVKDCIDKYCQKEQLEDTEMWYCNKCQKHVRAWKQFHLYRLPPILIVHLKRFHYSSSTHRRDKIGAFVDFPLKGLDLSDLVSHWKDGERPVYDCYAVSNHYGGLGGGHYTAYTANSDGTWNYYDDSRVTKNVDPKEVVTEAAYVLYYRRADLSDQDDIVQELLDDELGTSIYGENGSSFPSRSNHDDAMALDERMEQENIHNSKTQSPSTSMEESSIDHQGEGDGAREDSDFGSSSPFPDRNESVPGDDFALQ